MKKVALISSYCDNDNKVKILKENILKLKDLGLDVFVISPINLSTEIIDICDFVFFTKENPLLLWPIRSFTFWKTVYTKDGWIMLHHNVADYGWAALNQVKRMSEIALHYDYDLFYHIIYDLDIDEKVVSEILNNHVNLIHPRINPKNPKELWEATLHFMIFDKVTMKKIVDKIDLKTYLDSNGVAEGQALKWASEIPLKIVEHPVKDRVYYWEDKDFFDYSKNNRYKFFFSKNTDSEIWIGEPPKKDFIDGNLKIIFYDIKDKTDIVLKINDKQYSYTISESIVFYIDQNSKEIYSMIIDDGEYVVDLSDDIKNTNRNLIYYETKFT